MQSLWKTIWSFLEKIKIELPNGPTIPLMGIYPKEKKNINSKRYLHLSVYSSVIYNSQDMEANSVSNNKWMDKEDPYIKGERCVCVCVCVCGYSATQWNGI